MAFVPREGLAPSRVFTRRILSPVRFLFRHPGNILSNMRPWPESHRRIGDLQSPALLLSYMANLFKFTSLLLFFQIRQNPLNFRCFGYLFIFYKHNFGDWAHVQLLVNLFLNAWHIFNERS